MTSAVPHVDIVRSGAGWLALVHEANSVGPRILQGNDLQQLHRRITSMLIGEHGVSEDVAQSAPSDATAVRNVESTIMAAWVKGTHDAGSK